MDKLFAAHVEAVVPSFGQLVLERDRGAVPKAAGVYLFVEHGVPLLVGRSRDLRQRQIWHCSGDYNQATFAFELSRQATGSAETSPARGESKRFLMHDVRFASAFADAKERIRHMAYHWVVESDPIRQALLEIYSAISLRTPFRSG
jgi:hypothetical protein